MEEKRQSGENDCVADNSKNSLSQTEKFDVTELKRKINDGSVYTVFDSEHKKASGSSEGNHSETTVSVTKSVYGKRRYIQTNNEVDRNMKHARTAAENDDYELKEMMARGAECVLYRAVSGSFTFCAKSIRNNWSKLLGSKGADTSKAKLENVAYRTKVRHLMNEHAVSQRLNEDGAMPIVRIFSLRKVRRFGVEVGYDLLMEYLSGHDLSDKVLTKVLPLEDKIRVMYQAALALQYVHNKQIIHLDIKPSNFMLVENKIKLIDFGVSVTSGHHFNAVTGTGGYLSPEQICKDTTDARTDIFAFGVAFGVFFGSKPLVQPQDELMTHQARQESRYNLEHTAEPAMVEFPALAEMPLIADCLRQCTIMRRDKRMPSMQLLANQIRERAETYGIVL